MGLLAIELVALIVLVAADDLVHHRGPTATWAVSIRVIAAATVAVLLVTWLQTATGGDIF